MNYSIMHELLD